MTSDLSQLTSDQNEIANLTSTDTGQVIDAKTTLNQFLSDAKVGNYQAMWPMLSPDCQALYSTESDFQSNNIVTQKYSGFYVMDSYYVGSGSLLASWQGYTNVPEIQVVLVANESTAAGVGMEIIAQIPIINLISGMIPTTEIYVWNAHCVHVGNTWEIYCERDSSSTSASGTQSTTTTPTTTTTVTGPGPFVVTAQELLSNSNSSVIYNGKILQVTGPVKDFNIATKTVTLGQVDSSGWVSCYFQDSTAAQISSLSKGQTITIQGNCTGGDLFGPTLNSCSFVK